MLTLSVSQISLSGRSVFVALICIFQTFCSVHILLLEQKSEHVVVFFAGSGHAFPESW